MKSTHSESFSGLRAREEYKSNHIVMHRLYLHTLVLLSCEPVGADGSHRDVGSDQGLVLEEEGERVHPTEGRADHHHRAQLQVLTYFLQETCRGQFTHRGWGLSWLRTAKSCEQTQRFSGHLSALLTVAWVIPHLKLKSVFFPLFWPQSHMVTLSSYCQQWWLWQCRGQLLMQMPLHTLH